ncbi:MAG: hypothetical protein HKM95_08885 [Inquilinus sp.]|nr:hypothetical protein [Inquilinus sp.]
MSQIDELRDRLLSAERQFHSASQQSRGYRERLLGLMSRIEEEIRSRQAMQAQQADELRRLLEENDQLRSMLFSLLQAVETRDDTLLDDTLSEMDGRIAALIGEGQGARPEAPVADEPAMAAEDDPIVMAPYEADEAESTEVFADDAVTAEPMIDEPVGADEAEEVAEDRAEDVAMAMPAMDDGEAEFEPMADSESLAEAESMAAADLEPMPDADTVTGTAAPEPEYETSTLTADPAVDDADALNEFLGITPGEAAEAESAESIDYSFATGGWADDIVEEPAADEPVAEESEPSVALADEDDEPAPGDDGSIHDLIDRVKKTHMEGDGESGPDEDGENDGTAAAE